MTDIHVEVTATIDARPETVYAILVDYREGHPSVLPKPYFKDVEVLEGGVGAGTVARVAMDVMGAKRTYTLVVSEPEPGRVLAEEDRTAGTRTRFVVEPRDGGARSQVTIATDSATAPGLRGALERLMNPSIMRRIYREELAQLNDVARGREARA